MNTAIIVDNHDVFRSILKKQLQRLFDKQLQHFNIVGEAKDGTCALELVKTEKPDLIFLDLFMPGRSGISIIPDILLHHEAIKILVLTMDDSAERARAAIDMGASGYCLKDEGIDALNSAISAVMRGETYVSPLLVERRRRASTSKA